MRANLIAFCGYGRAGKDEAAKTLIKAGYARVAFGDIIKGVFDELVKNFLGFSAFTEDSAQKQQIRPLLEQGGEVFYDYVYNTFFSQLPSRAVNTRLCRVREAKEWIKRGGIIVEVVRPGLKPDTQWSKDIVDGLKMEGLVTYQIHNDGTLEDLAVKVRTLFEIF
jgi:hypothetical protein